MRIEQRTIELLSPITQTQGQPIPDESDIRRISEPTGKIAIPRNDVDLFFVIDLKCGIPLTYFSS
jgi:hypothetical protein